MSGLRDEVDNALAEGRLAEDLWDSEKVAAFLGVDKETLHVWRSKGIGPRSYKAGGLKYDPVDVRAYLLATAREGAKPAPQRPRKPAA